MAPHSDTIFALSSGRPPAAVAVIRISGSHARLALEKLIGRVPEPRQASLVRVRNPQSGEIIDEALALWFPAPRSETGEDMAELQIHGGRAVIAAVLESLGRVQGLRPAEPGEFTRRAFENGRLDLTAIEGLADLIGAETEAQRRQAYRQLKGLLGARAEAWRARLIEALALVEAGIDFSDEGDVPQNLLGPALDVAGALHAEIAAALDRPGHGERLREGLVVAIAGPPNAGKSTLLNRIARREVAIVSPHAGTTRDVIEVHLDLDGYPVTLLDTAGVRESDDPVEQEGVRRAKERAAAADLVLWITEAVRPVADDAGTRPRAAGESGASQGGGAAADGAIGRAAAAAGGRPLASAAIGGRVEGGRSAAELTGPLAELGRGVPIWRVVNKSDLFDPCPGPGSSYEKRPGNPDMPPDLGQWPRPPGESPPALSIEAKAPAPRTVLEHPSAMAAKAKADKVKEGSLDNGAHASVAMASHTPYNESLFENESEIIFYVSALYGKGIAPLLAALSAYAQHYFGAESALITRERHRRSLEEARAALARAMSCQAKGEEIIAEELRLAARSLGRLTGKVDVEDILDAIFRDFCIGK